MGRTSGTRTWTDLSPKAQQDILTLKKEKKLHTVGEMKEVKKRKNRNSFDAFNRTSRYSSLFSSHRAEVAQFLDVLTVQKATLYKTEHPKCNQEEAEKWVSDTYMWSSESAEGRVMRLLSLEAQQDAENYIEEHYPELAAKYQDGKVVRRGRS